MTMRPFRLATIMEAIKIAELRYLEARVGGMNNATTYWSDRRMHSRNRSMRW